MSKTKSVMEQVKEFIATHPKFKVIDVKAGLASLPRNQVGTAVWKLEKTNVVRKISADEYELTPVNNTAQPAVEPQPAKTKPKAKRKPRTNAPSARVVQLKKELEHATRELLHWSGKAKNADRLEQELRQTQHDLTEALVLIRYLERKLITAIQFDARNNGRNT